MNGKLKKNIGFSMMIFSFFFLFEPSYSLIDPLPDAIGYGIMCLSLVNLADINDRMNSALKAFSRGIILGLLKIACYFILNNIFGKDEASIGQLLFVFVFAFFEIYMILPGYKHLFEGMLSLGTFENGDAVFAKKREKGKNATEKLYRLTLLFLIAKNVLCCLPEFTTLETNSSNEFLNIMRILSIALMSPLSLIWLINTVKYFLKVKNDNMFVESLQTKYREKADAAPDFFVGRMLCVGAYAIMISYLLTFDVYSEGVNILPDALAYLGFILSAVLLKGFSRKWSFLALTSVFGVSVSLWTYFIEKEFYERYTIGAVDRHIEAYEHYYLMLSVYILQAVIFCVTVASLTAFICDIYKDHARPKQGEHDFIKKESNNGFMLRVILFAVSGIVSAAASVYNIWALTQNNRLWFFYASGVISGVISIASISALFALVFFIIGEVKKNYKTHL